VTQNLKPDANSAIELEGVSKFFGRFKAVDNLSFRVKRGSITGFLGPNGAGKTTSVRLMLGLLRPTEGHMSVLGHDGGIMRDRIGFLPEERGLYRKLSAIETIVFLAGLKGVGSGLAKKRAMALLEAQGLGKFANEQIRNLSKGMSQKVQLIATLVHEPDLLLLDEPFSGLDPVNQQGLEDVIRSAADRGATVLFSTHVMAHAERLCESVIMLARGQKVFDGTIDEVRRRGHVLLRLWGPLDPSSLAQLPFVIGVEVLGLNQGRDGSEGFVLALSSGANAANTLKAAFSQGLPITHCDIKEPTLHDAFMALTDQNSANSITAGE
jgi:ABC-2 type transport system ATP-binding protein